MKKVGYLERKMDDDHLRYLSILLIEDDPDIRDIAVLALRLDAGVHVITEQTGASALATLKRIPRPDVILVDAQLSDMTGVTLARTIRRDHDIPIIFVTAAVRSADHTSYHEAGAIGVIAKPFDPLSLATMVRHLLLRATSGTQSALYDPAPSDNGDCRS